MHAARAKKYAREGVLLEKGSRKDYSESETWALPDALPVMPLRGIAVFPGMHVTLEAARPESLHAYQAAMKVDGYLLLVCQRDMSQNSPAPEDLYTFGTVGIVRKTLRVPETPFVKLMVEGLQRAKLGDYVQTSPYFEAHFEIQAEREPKHITEKHEILMRKCVNLFEDYSNLNGSIPPETVMAVAAESEPGHLADSIAQHMFMRFKERQAILEELRAAPRLTLLSKYLSREVNILQMQRTLDEGTQEKLYQSQRELYLREQLTVIQKELGDDGTAWGEYQSRIASLNLPPAAESKLYKELEHLSKQPFGSSEAALLRNYLDLCLELPWHERSEDIVDIARARHVLEEDHFGLERVKERIIEFLAVRKQAPGVKGDVLCLVGPPGVGKTSIAMSIARATCRKLARISLGGVHDEAEIRGHRKTYVGAMPGRIIAGLQQAKSMNPVMVLDEIDKLGRDSRGDPSAALLEALDAEQNTAFRDHYLEIPIDLSEVFFITTANTTETIPRALLDRMEVIEIGSYTDEEKLQIVRQHFLFKQMQKHGLTEQKLTLTDDAIREVITLYTKESGVRVLERKIAAICRKTTAAIVEGKREAVHLEAGALEPFLGPPRYRLDAVYPHDEVGLVRGLAWTQTGGEVLDVEANVMPGTGRLELTGNLGDVMKESARAAVSYIRTRSEVLGLPDNFYKKQDIHIHFPEGAVPKDGPSAGIAICLAVISALTNNPVRRDVAMTGEISLRGRILPIGGLREKTMAARRVGIHDVIIPMDNRADLDEIDQTVRDKLHFIFASHIDDILQIALVQPLAKADLPHLRIGQDAPDKHAEKDDEIDPDASDDDAQDDVHDHTNPTPQSPDRDLELDLALARMGQTGMHSM